MKLTLIIGLVLVLTAAPANAGRKIALVIGNAAYSVANGRLANPVNDAKSISRRLKQLGFEVLYRPNLKDKEAMETAVEEFSRQISDAEIALFYYSGHGVQRNGINYLMPTQAKINNARQIRHRAMNTSFLIDEMKVNTQGLSLVILDACRDDPFPRDSKSSSSRGLARIKAPSGTIIAYATEPGSTAADGIGNHSPYTAQLLRHLNDFSQQPIDDVLNRINVAVEDATGHKQSPRLEMSPLRVVPCFAQCSSGGLSPKPKPRPITAQAYSLYIKTTPADATVRILNIGPTYQAGMALKPGQYKVEVTKLGYPRHVSQFELTAENQVYYVELKKERPEFSPIFQPIPKPKNNLKDSFTEMEFVAIKAGCFQMGSPESEAERSDDERQHRVCINQNFYLGKYEVTQAQWIKVMGSNPSKNKRDNNPVENVSWEDVQVFITKLNQKTGLKYRLPTEAEWEYAARAGTTTPFYTGRCINTEQANYNGNFDYNGCGAKTGLDRKETVAVGQFQPNGWGLYDMSGNVREWTCSEYDEEYSGGESQCLSTNHTNKHSILVLRGGAFSFRPRGARSANRGRTLPWICSYYEGFRLARTLF